MLFASNSDKTLTIIRQNSADDYTVLQTVATGEGSKQIALDAKTGRIFLPAGKFGPTPEPTAKFPHPLAPVVPGTFEILVLGQ